MDKANVINDLISKVYAYNGKNVLNKKEIKEIEKFFDNNSTKYSDVQELLKQDSRVYELTKNLKSVKSELNKQLKERKALQSGILFECVCAQTLASILGLNRTEDAENLTLSNMPKEIKKFFYMMQEKAHTACAVRYVYYKKDDYSNILFQYGNPETTGDLTLVLNETPIIIEVKDVPALIQDKDLRYDENGKFIISEDIVNDAPNFIDKIKEFNNVTNVFEMLGHNYPILKSDSPEEKKKFIEEFLNSDIDILMTSKSNKLVILKKEDLLKNTSDGLPLLDISGSEIRTTGKNSLRHPFTPKYLNKVLSDSNIRIDADNICIVDKHNTKIIGYKKGRLTSKETRFKINQCFFVKKNCVEEYADCYKFKLTDINQCKSGISIHINIKKSKLQIKKELYS